ncbi:High potential iron-sulfur protein [Ahniella affigens]|uniref:High potential iron-sulfur protein n=1 Tax=Ahniella affigens TaxID=2021234 RepID=A0A2P1PTK6_9GAMM|nr:high-potential iron-sulfur protein [Ahniella affigens]AVP98176.1 High potential iron-sulfur protein [Ahniella affigens]
MSTSELNRREFLTLIAVAGGTLALSTAAKAETLPQLAETDPTAAALGYKHDATKVDAAKYPTYKAGQHCATCKLAQGADGDAWRPCSIFPGKSVDAKGWCAAYSAKA